MRSRAALAVATSLSLALGTAAVALPLAGTSSPVADRHVKRLAVSPRVAAALGSAGEMRGMAINDVQLTGTAGIAATSDFARMALEGITSVSLYVYLYVSDPTAGDVHTGRLTPTDEQISAVASAARLNNLDLQLQPVLLDDATNSWRGRYRPSSLPAFFASYTQQVLHYADLAEANGATLFYVGSENNAIAGQTSSWRALIAQVRQHFSGALSYMATGYTPLDVKFWRQLDLVSFSPYFSLGEDATPSYERARAAWAQVHTPYVRGVIKKLRMPIVYGEAGYHSQQGAFATPQVGTSVNHLAAPAAQANAYRALLDVLAQEPGVYGVTWWRWEVGTTPADTGYSPAGKPAECVIASHWSQDADVRAAAAGAQCDLAQLDATLVAAARLLPAL